MTARNILLVCFDTFIVFGVISLLMYFLPLEMSIPSGVYIFVIGSGALREVMYATNAKNSTPPDPWWVPCIGLGLGLGIWMLMTYSNTLAIHIPLLVLTSFATTIIMHTLLKRVMKPST